MHPSIHHDSGCPVSLEAKRHPFAFIDAELDDVDDGSEEDMKSEIDVDAIESCLKALEEGAAHF